MVPKVGSSTGVTLEVLVNRDRDMVLLLEGQTRPCLSMQGPQQAPITPLYEGIKTLAP